MIIYATLYRTYDGGAMSVNPLGLAARVAANAKVWAGYGINAVLWPPLTMSQGGTAVNADGYGKQSDLDIGQWPGRPTRWGTAAQVLEANRELHAHGLMALEDAVIHQYAGALPIYEIGADGKTDKALFPKMPSCFVPQVKADEVFDADGNAAFGQMVSYQNSTPAGYMLHGVTQAMQWRRRVLALDGWREDDGKGTAVSVSQRLMERVGGWCFAEVFTGNPDELAQYVAASGGQRVLDFTLHWAIKAACEGTNSLYALPGNGFYARDSDHAVLFVESADTDNTAGENVRWNKMWGYLLILTLPAAAAMIYAGDMEKYGLGPQIYNLCWIGSTFAFGALRWEHTENDVILWSRNGDGGAVGWSGGLICGFNRTGDSRTVWIKSPTGTTHWHDYSGHGPDAYCNADGWLPITIPAQNYVAYAPADVNHAIPITPRPHHATAAFTDFSDITVKYEK